MPSDNATLSKSGEVCVAAPVFQEKLYTNADVSKMVKEAVSAAVACTRENYEKILQDKLAGECLPWKI
jgi:hypothetical protein